MIATMHGVCNWVGDKMRTTAVIEERNATITALKIARVVLAFFAISGVITFANTLIAGSLFSAYLSYEGSVVCKNYIFELEHVINKWRHKITTEREFVDVVTVGAPLLKFVGDVFATDHNFNPYY